jgi:hypothetical protein
MFADDPERLARFEREAKVLASLNHPNIASICGRKDAPLSWSSSMVNHRRGHCVRRRLEDLLANCCWAGVCA